MYQFKQWLKCSNENVKKILLLAIEPILGERSQIEFGWYLALNNYKSFVFFVSLQ
jgi:hypothetical protein